LGGKKNPFSRFEYFEHAIFSIFVSNFEHVNFKINEKYSLKNDNENYYVSLVIFQTCKNIVLRNVPSFG